MDPVTIASHTATSREVVKPIAQFVSPEAVLILQQIRHPALPWLREIRNVAMDGQPPVPCFIFSYLPGTSLDRLSAQERSNWLLPDKVRYMARLARTVAFLHQQGERSLLHLDIKPANLLLSPNQQPALIDFGSARLYPVIAGSSSQEIGDPNEKYACTPAYAAPELLAGQPCPASDIYALGLTLLALVTDREPQAGQPAALAAQLAELPAALARIINRCLQSQPDKRYPLAAELAAALEEAAQQMLHGFVLPENQQPPRLSAQSPLFSPSGGVTGQPLTTQPETIAALPDPVDPPGLYPTPDSLDLPDWPVSSRRLEKPQTAEGPATPPREQPAKPSLRERLTAPPLRKQPQTAERTASPPCGQPTESRLHEQRTGSSSPVTRSVKPAGHHPEPAQDNSADTRQAATARIICIWDGSEFGCELAVMLSQQHGRILVVDADLLNPRADLLLGQRSRTRSLLPATRPASLDQAFADQLRGVLTASRLRDLTQWTLVDGVEILVSGTSLDQYEHLSSESLYHVLRTASLAYDLIILLCSRFVYDAFTCLGLMLADQVIIPLSGHAADFREFNRYIDFLALRRQIDRQRLHFVAFAYNVESDLSWGTMDELCSGRLAGCISATNARQRLRGAARPYATAINRRNQKEYTALLIRLGRLPDKEPAHAAYHIPRNLRRKVRRLSSQPAR